MRTIVLVVAMLGACTRSPPPDPGAEHAAWDRLLRTMRELHTLEHACDAERYACREAQTSSVVTARDGGPASRALRTARERAEASVVSCEERQPDYVATERDRARPASTSEATKRARNDRLNEALAAWLDACGRCRNRDDCTRRLLEVFELPGEAILTYAAPPLCR